MYPFYFNPPNDSGNMYVLLGQIFQLQYSFMSNSIVNLTPSTHTFAFT